MILRRLFVGMGLVVAVTATGLVPGIVREFDAQKQSAPPHTARPVAGVRWNPGQGLEAQVLVDLAAWEAGVQRAEQEAAERAAAEAAEAAAQAQRDADLRARAGSSGGGGSAGTCDGFVIPGDIVWAESHCNYEAVNPTGCGGYTCVGAYQFDLRHWQPGGGCADLGDWHDPAAQDECARRLSNGGTNLRPWGR